MFEIFSYAFMQKAFFAGLVVAVICPTVGIYLVLRRLSLVGEMFAHVSLAGVALGMLTGTYPLATALCASLLAAAALEALRHAYRVFADLAVAITISAGISLAVIFISLGRSFNADLYSFLFGSILAISARDLVMISVTGFVVVLFVLLLQKELFYIAFDEDAARVAGIPVDAISAAFIIGTALTIAVAMRVVGALLVSSLITVPVAAALQVGRSFRATMVLSYLFSVLSVILGLFFSYHLNLAPGGSIVIISVMLFLAAAVGRKLLTVRRGDNAGGIPGSTEK